MSDDAPTGIDLIDAVAEETADEMIVVVPQEWEMKFRQIMGRGAQQFEGGEDVLEHVEIEYR